jgi:uncharacterized membrane-anchored protein YhcB (DUF1043 family)
MGTSSIILLVLFCTTLAGLIGWQAQRKWSQQAKIQHTLEKQLEEKTTALEHYQLKVHDHFAESARLFNQLTLEHQNLYQHLAHSAQTLCHSTVALPDTQVTHLLTTPGEATSVLTPAVAYPNPLMDTTAPAHPPLTQAQTQLHETTHTQGLHPTITEAIYTHAYKKNSAKRDHRDNMDKVEEDEELAIS